MNSDGHDFHEQVRSLTSAHMLVLLAFVVAIGIASAFTGDFAVTALCAFLAAALGGYIVSGADSAPGLPARLEPRDAGRSLAVRSLARSS